MQQSIIILLILCILLAILGFYFGFIRPPRVMAWLQQSTFLIMTFMLIPIILLVLYSQDGSLERLTETGFMLHPAITESVGIGYGKGTNPTWVFEINSNKNEIRDFYLSAENTGEWTLSTDSDIMLIYKKGNQRMTIGIREGRSANTLIFTLNEIKN